MKSSYVSSFFGPSWGWGVSSKTSRRNWAWRDSFVQLGSGFKKGRLPSCLLVGTGAKALGDVLRRDDQTRWEHRPSLLVLHP